MTIIMGANLLRGKLFIKLGVYTNIILINSAFVITSIQPAYVTHSGFKRSGVGIWLLIGIIVVRFVFLPIIGVGVITVAKNLGIVGSDPLYHFVILLQYAVPPAMAIGKSLLVMKANAVLELLFRFPNDSFLMDKILQVLSHSCLKLVRLNVLLSCSGITLWHQSR